MATSLRIVRTPLRQTFLAANVGPSKTGNFDNILTIRTDLGLETGLTLKLEKQSGAKPILKIQNGGVSGGGGGGGGIKENVAQLYCKEK